MTEGDGDALDGAEFTVEYHDRDADERRKVAYFQSGSDQWYRQSFRRRYDRWQPVGVSTIDEPTIEVADD